MLQSYFEVLFPGGDPLIAGGSVNDTESVT